VNVLAETATDVPSFAAWIIGIVGVLGVASIVGVARILLSIKDGVNDVKMDVAVIKTKLENHGEKFDKQSDDIAELERQFKESGKRLDQVYRTINTPPRPA